MLEDVAGIRRVVLACGTVDLRKGIDGLAMIIGNKYNQNPFEKGTLFLFCGKRFDRCKGLLWMGTGFLLLNKRFEDGRLSVARTTGVVCLIKLTKELLRNSIVTPSLLASVMNVKNVNSSALNRIEQEFERNGVNISKQTMSNWIVLCNSHNNRLPSDKNSYLILIKKEPFITIDTKLITDPLQ